MKKTLVFAFWAFCNLTSIAQTTAVPRIAHAEEKLTVHVPPEEPDVALKKIYSNLGVSKTDLYYDVTGLPVAGPNTLFDTSFGAMQFTPKDDSHVSQVQVAIQYFG